MKRLMFALAALAMIGMACASTAVAGPPKSFVVKKLTGYCGTVTAANSDPTAVTVHRASDPWRRASKLPCKAALHTMRSYYREVPTKGQGSGGYLKVGPFTCSSVPIGEYEQSHHATDCTGPRHNVISTDDPVLPPHLLVACSARKLSEQLKKRFAHTDARMIDHRCTRSAAAAKVSFRGKILRFGFATEDGDYWVPQRMTVSDLTGQVSPRYLNFTLATVNSLGRAMSRDRHVERYAIR